MKLFAGLRKIRELQKVHLPFVHSIIDFDIIIEIGYAEEVGKPFTVKQFYLLDICSRSTVRRKLATLVDQGVVVRRDHANDKRAKLLLIAAPTVKLLTRYSGALRSVSAAHFAKKQLK
jgi:DNA-binding MarR family transcriptional regulator